MFRYHCIPDEYTLAKYLSIKMILLNKPRFFVKKNN